MAYRWRGRVRASVRRARHEAPPPAPRVRGGLPRGARPDGARAEGRPRVRDRDEDGRGRDAGAHRPRVQEVVRRAELRPAAQGRAREPVRSDPRARRAVLLDGRPDPARDRRQPVRDPREPRPRGARAVQDPAAGPRLYRARPPDRLRAPRAARVPRRRPLVHQPRAHAAALPRADGPHHARHRGRHAGRRVLLDQASRQDRGGA